MIKTQKIIVLHDYSTLNVQDISAFLMTCDWQNIKLKPLEIAENEIWLHELCTFRNGQKTHQCVINLLNKYQM